MTQDEKQAAQATRLATIGELAISIAHELSQPLNTIRLVAENTLMAMEQGKADDRLVRQKLDLVVQQAENMSDLIKRMCVVGRKGGPLEAIDPWQAVRDAVALMETQLEQENIALITDLAGEGSKVMGRPGELAQVLVNLIGNARDAIIEPRPGEPAGTEPVKGGRIEVSIQDIRADGDAGTHVMIRVTDNGGGIPADDLDRVFDPFFSTKAGAKGTGLGLSISYGIVNAMGGRIAAENCDGGAQFTIRLPTVESA